MGDPVTLFRTGLLLLLRTPVPALLTCSRLGHLCRTYSSKTATGLLVHMLHAGRVSCRQPRSNMLAAVMHAG